MRAEYHKAKYAENSFSLRNADDWHIYGDVFGKASRMRLEMRAMAIGLAAPLVVSGCAQIIVNSLNHRPVAIDQRGVPFDLSPAITASNYRSLCLQLDTVRYGFHPPAIPFQPQHLTDTTIRARLGGVAESPPIILHAYLVASGGARAVFPDRWNTDRSLATGIGGAVSDVAGGSYGFSQEGAFEICFSNPQLAPGVVYERLVISSTRTLEVRRIEEHAYRQ
jgi:hypothetical protein